MRFARPRFQRGRGLGGVFQTLMKGIVPVVNFVKRMMNTETGKAITASVKDVAVETGSKLMSDIIKGKNVKQAVKENSRLAGKKVAKKVKRIGEPARVVTAARKRGVNPSRPSRKRRRLFSSEEEDEFAQSQN